ncbi:MAG: hypothetical protein MUC69_04220 [Gemmatimonadales bacterium]|jgi:hypothetical protein|nr:hypothetical protein [Gemmatimonadales bacterium]
MSRRSLLVLLALLAPGSPAAAQGGASPGTAQLAGVVATAVPAAIGGVMMITGDEGTTGFFIASGGMVLGPMVGNVVGGLGRRAALGSLLRGGVWAGSSIALLAWGVDETGDADVWLGVAIGGYAVLTGLAVWDLVTIPGAVRAKRGLEVSVAPTWVPATRSPGLALGLRF